MRVAVIGCGHVGLVTGACLALLGHHVTCTDSDEPKVRALAQGTLPFYEPHLAAAVERGRADGRLRFTTDSAEAVNAGEAVFICVATPPLESGEADLTAIDNVARQIATTARSAKLVVEKSTVPVRTGQQLKLALARYRPTDEVSFRVASNPEFLREGSAVADFLHPDRIVLGVEEAESEKQLRQLYRPLEERKFMCPVHEVCPATGPVSVLVTSIESAELIKHASNSFLALKLSYINSLADLCERVGADVEEIAHGMGLDRRIGPDYLRAGIGFGGFCLPKDLQAFTHLAERAGLDFTLLKEANRINQRRVEVFLDKLRETLWVVKDKQIGLLGLAYKPDTDDLRFAPALEVLRRLLAEGARVRAYDPQAVANARREFPNVEYGSDPYETAQGCDALLLLTEWEEFKTLDWPRLRKAMSRPLLLDGRNFLDASAVRAAGFEYYSIGRP